MVTAFSYTRFSTGKQSKGDSTRRQDEITAAICQREGWTLNAALRFSDHGKSGFHGKNVAEGGDLARFMACIESGEVQPGNVLIVECLDRISRQAPLESLEIIKQILKAGVTIRTGFDGMTYTYESVNQNNGQIYILLGILQRAHEESKTKSIRATAAWNQKQSSAATKIITTSTAGLPQWIRYNPTTRELELIPDRAEIMREMCRLALTMGAHSIARTFHTRGVQSWQKKGRWDVARITKMLKSRTLLGEYQPRKGRKDFGEPVKNYYPAILSEQEFYALQSVLMTRTKVIKGRRGPVVANLFGALATSEDGSVMRVNYKGANKRFISVDCMTGANANFISFPYNAFENSFLKHIHELDLSGSTNADRLEVAALEGQLATIRAKIDQTQAAAFNATGKTYDRILELLPKLEEQETELSERLEQAKAKAHRPQVTTSDVAALAAELENAPEDAKVIGREKLKTAIQAVVESVKLFMRRESKLRTSRAICLALVTLRDGWERAILVTVQAGQSTSQSLGIRFHNADLDAPAMADALLAGEALHTAFIAHHHAQKFQIRMDPAAV